MVQTAHTERGNWYMNTLRVMSGKPVNEDVQKALHKRYYTMESKEIWVNYPAKPTMEQVEDDLDFGATRISWTEDGVQIIVTGRNSYRINGYNYRCSKYSLQTVLGLE